MRCSLFFFIDSVFLCRMFKETKRLLSKVQKFCLQVACYSKKISCRRKRAKKTGGVQPRILNGFHWHPNENHLERKLEALQLDYSKKRDGQYFWGVSTFLFQL